MAIGVDLARKLQLITMNASLSGSSNSNDDSNSDAGEDIEEDLEDMLSSPSATPLMAFSYAVQSFPSAAFLQLSEGLNRLPTWTVYPASLAECLQATTEITRHFGRCASSCCSHSQRFNVHIVRQCWHARGVFHMLRLLACQRGCYPCGRPCQT